MIINWIRIEVEPVPYDANQVLHITCSSEQGEFYIKEVFRVNDLYSNFDRIFSLAKQKFRQVLEDRERLNAQDE